MLEKKTTSQLEKIAQKHYNQEIRERDLLPGDVFRCISCGDVKDKKQMNAGHLFSAGNFPSVRFHPHNVNGQCIKCNRYATNETGLFYRRNLIKKVGLAQVQTLEIAAITGIGRKDRTWLLAFIKSKHKRQ